MGGGGKAPTPQRVISPLEGEMPGRAEGGAVPPSYLIYEFAERKP
jgi:hypothetical protein